MKLLNLKSKVSIPAAFNHVFSDGKRVTGKSMKLGFYYFSDCFGNLCLEARTQGIPGPRVFLSHRAMHRLVSFLLEASTGKSIRFTEQGDVVTFTTSPKGSVTVSLFSKSGFPNTIQGLLSRRERRTLAKELMRVLDSFAKNRLVVVLRTPRKVLFAREVLGQALRYEIHASRGITKRPKKFINLQDARYFMKFG
jgi:hypothetical protein